MKQLLVTVLAGLAAALAALPSARAQGEIKSCEIITNSDWQGCIATCTRLIGSGRHAGAQLSTLHSSRGSCYRRTGQMEPALADLARAIALNPNNGDAYLNRSALYGQQKRYDLSIADATRAIQLMPRDPLPYFNRCVSHQRSGKAALAVPDCRAAVRLDPTYEAPKTFLRGMCLQGVQAAC